MTRALQLHQAEDYEISRNELLKDRPSISVLTPDLAGGGMTRAYLIAQVLRHLGHPVRILGYLASGRSLYPEPPADIPVKRVLASSYVGLIAQLVGALNDDIVYAIKPHTNSLGVALLSRLVRRHRLIVDIDDWEPGFFRVNRFHGPSSGVTHRLSQPLSHGVRILRGIRDFSIAKEPAVFNWLQELISSADAITANTRFLQQHYSAVYLPSGKDTSIFDPARFNTEHVRAALGLSRFEVLMFPGTPVPHKGLEDVLAAIAQLDRPQLRLVIVGGRMDGERYARHLLTRWSPWILRLPATPLNAMPRVIAAAHVVVVPQRDTPVARAQFPMKLTDAMAMAKPIISTRVGDIPEIVDNTAYLVEPGCPDAIAAKIDWVLNNPDEASVRGREARLRCIAYFNLDRLSETLRDVLDSVV